MAALKFHICNIAITIAAAIVLADAAGAEDIAADHRSRQVD